jgi:hypothetical protein
MRSIRGPAISRANEEKKMSNALVDVRDRDALPVSAFKTEFNSA